MNTVRILILHFQETKGKSSKTRVKGNFNIDSHREGVAAAVDLLAGRVVGIVGVEVVVGLLGKREVAVDASNQVEDAAAGVEIVQIAGVAPRWKMAVVAAGIDLEVAHRRPNEAVVPSSWGPLVAIERSERALVVGGVAFPVVVEDALPLTLVVGVVEGYLLEESHSMGEVELEGVEDDPSGALGLTVVAEVGQPFRDASRDAEDDEWVDELLHLNWELGAVPMGVHLQIVDEACPLDSVDSERLTIAPLHYRVVPL